MSRSIPDPLLRFRPEFPILDKSTYLISNSLGAMPRAASVALAEYAETWASRGVRAWADSWWEMSATVGDDIAPLIGAPPGSVAMLPNVTTASAVLLTTLDYTSARNRIVMCIRLAPHFYTTDAELESCFEAIDEIRDSGSWRRWQSRPAIVT